MREDVGDLVGCHCDVEEGEGHAEEDCKFPGGVSFLPWFICFVHIKVSGEI